MKLIRLSATEQVIIKMLINSSKPMYARQLVNESKGRIKSNTAYLTLQRMVDKKYLITRKALPDGTKGRAKRYYKTTALGRKTFNIWNS